MFELFYLLLYKTSIRMRAASERLNSICLNTELKNNIKIISKDITLLCKILCIKEKIFINLSTCLSFFMETKFRFL